MLFIARRLFGHGSGSRASRSAVRIATAGVAVGVLVMLISFCISQAFQKEIRTKVSSLGGHIQVVNSKGLYQGSNPIQITPSLCRRLQNIPHVRHVQRYAQIMGMLKTDDAFRGICLRGVDRQYDVTFLASCLTEGRVPQFGAGEMASDSMLISQRTASALQLHAGDRVYAYFFDRTLRARRFTVAGIFQTYMSDFDEQLTFIDSRQVQQLQGWRPDQYTAAEVLVDDFKNLDETGVAINRLVLKLSDPCGAYYSAPTVRDLFPQIFSWLGLLDTNVVAILILMMLVAGVTMTSGLLIIILERTQFIGVMKAMGATNSQLRHMFLYLAGMIVVRGLAVGNAFALGLLALQKYTHLVRLNPDNYYLNTVPVCFPWVGIVAIDVVTLIICVLVLVIPSYLVSRIMPAKSIRFE